MPHAPREVRWVSVSDAMLAAGGVTCDEWLARDGIDTRRPFRGRDEGNGVHFYQQDVEERVQEHGNPAWLAMRRRPHS